MIFRLPSFDSTNSYLTISIEIEIEGKNFIYFGSIQRYDITMVLVYVVLFALTSKLDTHTVIVTWKMFWYGLERVMTCSIII